MKRITVVLASWVCLALLVLVIVAWMCVKRPAVLRGPMSLVDDPPAGVRSAGRVRN
jgi:hypothetical protein